MHDTGDNGLTAREIGNVQFLIGQQIALIDVLDLQGRDSHTAQDLLRRLMRCDEDMRQHLGPPRGGQDARTPV